MELIQVNDLRKNYGEFPAVKGVTFSVNEGEIFGFLGPNGAGKTTVINMLTGLARITSGRAEISGYDCAKEIKQIQALIALCRMKVICTTNTPDMKIFVFVPPYTEWRRPSGKRERGFFWNNSAWLKQAKSYSSPILKG